MTLTPLSFAESTLSPEGEGGVVVTLSLWGEGRLAHRASGVRA